MRLAELTGCKDCHRRLENGLIPFAQYTPIRVGMRVLPQAAGADPKMKFYVTGADDLRAEGPATAAWLGETMSKQREFSECIVKRTEDIVYGGYVVPPAIHEAVVAHFHENLDYRVLMEDVVAAWVKGGPAR
jgi:hypothetical protein